jgi:hypothetical protein
VPQQVAGPEQIVASRSWIVRKLSGKPAKAKEGKERWEGMNLESASLCGYIRAVTIY